MDCALCVFDDDTLGGSKRQPYSCFEESSGRNEETMEIVMLEKGSLGADLDLTYFEALGNVTYYDATTKEEAPERVMTADVLIANKLLMNEETLAGAKNLKLIALTATGTNNIDFDYTRKRGIQVKNVAGYSTDAVAQHTFALLFYLLHRMAYYDRYVKSGAYCESKGFSHFAEQFYELPGKTWGIVGMGAIGQKVAALASAFGCRVIYYSTSGQNSGQPYEQVDLDTLLSSSDIVSLHAPLNEKTERLIRRETLDKMKKTAYLINVARGGLVDEQDLADALRENRIKGAGLDVVTEEPIRRDNPLLAIQDSRKLVITPHMAWAPIETRERLMRRVYRNIEDTIKQFEQETNEEEYSYGIL